MNIKYIISLSALITLTGASCWGADVEGHDPFEGVPTEIIEKIIAESANPNDFWVIARLSPAFEQVLQEVTRRNLAAAMRN